MKTMTCKQLGGACDLEFHANTFEEMAAHSKKHGGEMINAGDPAHLQAMENMKKVMHTQEAMQQWFDERRKEFDALPDNA